MIVTSSVHRGLEWRPWYFGAVYAFLCVTGALRPGKFRVGRDCFSTARPRAAWLGGWLVLMSMLQITAPKVAVTVQAFITRREESGFAFWLGSTAVTSLLSWVGVANPIVALLFALVGPYFNETTGRHILVQLRLTFEVLVLCYVPFGVGDGLIRTGCDMVELASSISVHGLACIIRVTAFVCRHLLLGLDAGVHRCLPEKLVQPSKDECLDFYNSLLFSRLSRAWDRLSVPYQNLLIIDFACFFIGLPIYERDMSPTCARCLWTLLAYVCGFFVVYAACVFRWATMCALKHVFGVLATCVDHVVSATEAAQQSAPRLVRKVRIQIEWKLWKLLCAKYQALQAYDNSRQFLRIRPHEWLNLFLSMAVAVEIQVEMACYTETTGLSFWRQTHQTREYCEPWSVKDWAVALSWSVGMTLLRKVCEHAIHSKSMHPK